MSNEAEQPAGRPGMQGWYMAASAARVQHEETRETWDRLRNIAAGVSAATGEAFFRLLTQHLCLALKMDFACIGELQGENRLTVKTIELYDGAQFSEGLDALSCATQPLKGNL